MGYYIVVAADVVLAAAAAVLLFFFLPSFLYLSFFSSLFLPSFHSCRSPPPPPHTHTHPLLLDMLKSTLITASKLTQVV